MKEGGGFLPLLPTLSPLTRAALKHTTRPACNKAASQCCLSLKRFVVVLAGFCHIFHFKLRIKMFQRFRSPPKNSFVCRQKENWTRTLRRFALTKSQRPKRELFILFMVINCMNQSMELIKLPICHFTNEKRTGAEMYPEIVSGIVTGEAPVSFL